jgi:hypothetical protein
MSLDVYLVAATPPTAPNSGIFVRRNGQTVEMSRQEWDRAFPGQEPVVLAAEYGVDCTVYEANITHNLGKMAAACGLHVPLWRPEEIGAAQAKALIAPIWAGLELLRSDPDEFKKLNPSNGWGSYEGLVRFATGYLAACKQYPEAAVRVSR